MKTVQILVFVIFFISTFSMAEGNAKHDATIKSVTKPFEVMPFKLPKPYEQEMGGYRNKWARITGFEYSGLHWGQFVVIFVNQGVDIYKNNYLAYIQNYADEDDDDEDEEDSQIFEPYKSGTIFVKENYLSDGGHPSTPFTLTIMKKHAKGYDPKNGDWEYLQSDVNGKVLLQGDANEVDVHKQCAECHQNMAERDYIFSTYFSAEVE